MLRALILLLLLAAPTRKPEPPPVEELRQEVGAWELARQLALSDAQKAALRPLIEEQLARRAEGEARRDADAPELTRLLQAHLAELKAGRDAEATRAALRDFAEAHRPDDAREHRQQTRAALEEILSPEQQEVLQRFRPLAPSPDERREALAAEIGVDPDDLEKMQAWREQRRAERGEALRDERPGRDDRAGKLRALRVLFSAPMLDAIAR